MAFRAANATGNFNTAATWLQSRNTPTIHASTNVTLSTTPVNSATFTAPNTTNSVTGCMVYLVAKGTATTITATLQEATVDTAHTATITLSNVEAGSWIFFKPASPYTYTATTAGRYRWTLAVDSGTTTTVAQASTANFAYMSFDDQQVVPTTGDNVFIVEANGTTATTVTLDGTQAIGTAATSGASRSVTNALYIGTGGMLSGDTTATHQLTHQGHIYVDVGGELRVGTAGSPLSSSYTSTFIASRNQCGINFAAGAKATLQGTPKSSTSLWKTTLTSGVGTAASPMVVDTSVDWSVGDEILIAASSDDATNYNQTESRFIITKNSATSYVLSDTSGGSEVAFTHTHVAGTDIVNVQRNIIIKGSSSSLRTHFMIDANSSAGNIDIDWVRFEELTNSNFLGVPLAYVSLSDYSNIDYCVGYNSSNPIFVATGSVAATYTGLITYNTRTLNVQANTSYATFYTQNCSNKTLVDCFAMGSTGFGFGLNGAYLNTYNGCKAFASSTDANGAGVAIESSGQNTFTDFEAHANRGGGAYIISGSNNTFNSSDFGSKGTHATGDVVVGTGFIEALFNDSLFDSTTLLSGYTGMTAGSEVRFHKLDNTIDNHVWYTIYGSGQSTGASLGDTTIRTPGSLAHRLAPENLTTGFTWEFNIKAPALNIVAFTGWFRKNTAYGTSVARIELWLPGSTSADASVTLSNTTDVWQSVNISANNTDTKPGLATIKVVCLSTTSSAYLYCDDFYNAGDTVSNSDVLTGLDTWSRGKPASIIAPSAVSASDIWTFPTTNLTTANTTGDQVRKLLTVGKFLGLK